MVVSQTGPKWWKNAIKVRKMLFFMRAQQGLSYNPLFFSCLLSLHLNRWLQEIFFFFFFFFRKNPCCQLVQHPLCPFWGPGSTHFTLTYTFLKGDHIKYFWWLLLPAYHTYFQHRIKTLALLTPLIPYPRTPLWNIYFRPKIDSTVIVLSYVVCCFLQ